MNYNVVIFDLDGTILNTLDDLTNSVNFILQQNNFPIHSRDTICKFVGNGVPKLIERSLPANSTKQIQEKIYNEFSEYYKTHSMIKTKPYDGILELLQTLKTHKIKIAVNTNKTEQTAKIICQKFFPDLINFVAGGKPNIPHKPDPTGVNLILQNLKIAKENALYVGDSDVDFLTAQNAGLDYVLCDWGFRGKDFLIEHGAASSCIAKNANELEKKILN